MTEQELKPCPFCGGDPIRVAGSRGGRRTIHFIECIECGSHGEKFESLTEEEGCNYAMNSWNMRVGDK